MLKMKSFLFCRRAIHLFSGLSSKSPNVCRNFCSITASISHSNHHLSNCDDPRFLKNPDIPRPISLDRYFHCTREIRFSESSVVELPDSSGHEEAVEDEDGTTNEFLSRFVWIMRGKVSEAYPDYDKKTIDAMLLLVVQKVVEEIEKGGIEQMGSGSESPSQDFSDDLWRTVWEVSNTVLKDMEKERKKEKMKQFLQSPEVMEMCRFAGEIGIRGDLLRELRFKWAREKMEDADFYESLEQWREEAKAEEKAETEVADQEEALVSDEKQCQILTLPKRKGKFKYKIYGLDLSNKKWVETADKIHGAEEIDWREPKPVSGKCKLVMEKLLSLTEEDDPSELLAEWAELLEPHRIDWVALLDKVKGFNHGLYLKVAELVLDEKSYEANIRDYSILIDAHAKESRVEDVERLLKKMYQNGIFPDVVIATALVYMYSKSGKIDRAKEAFDSLRSYGFQPDLQIYSSMIMAYANAGQPKLAESILRNMEAKDIKPSEEVYMALLRSFAEKGDVGGATRISTTMQFAGIQPTFESCSLLVETYGKVGDQEQARSTLEYMTKVGLKPDDKCIASLIQAYKKTNSLDKALFLLLKLEKDAFDIGIVTYTTLLDWMAKLGLIDEAEQLLAKISQLAEVPPFEIHVSLCYMYSQAKNEKKTLQALEVLEAKMDQMGAIEFETVISGLKSGGFEKDARRMLEHMKDQGFAPSDKLKMTLSIPTQQAFSSRVPRMR